MRNQKEKEYLDAAAKTVLEEAENNPEVSIPVDPDVAEHLGAFESDEKLVDVVEGKEEPQS